MDKITIDRSEQYRDVSSARRHFPSGLPVRSLGYMPAKRNQAQRTFQRLSFMFTLKGNGDYRWGDLVREVRSPCVMIGYPDAHVEYGPHSAWEVFYMNYLPELTSAFEARRLISRDKPLWHLHDAAALRHRVVEILGALKSIDSFGCVDRIDRLCENLIVESLISAASPPLSDNDRAINNIRAYLEVHYRESIDFNALAESQGLSPSDFRRKWGARMHVAPGEFVGQLRIREASRLLVESEKNVKEIAIAVGYSDPLYFSRRFRQITGESASDYRKGVETP